MYETAQVKSPKRVITGCLNRSLPFPTTTDLSSTLLLSNSFIWLSYSNSIYSVFSAEVVPKMEDTTRRYAGQDDDATSPDVFPWQVWKWKLPMQAKMTGTFWLKSTLWETLLVEPAQQRLTSVLRYSWGLTMTRGDSK